MRAGDCASGFKPLTDFIDQLAKLTITSSLKINKIAASLSKTSTAKVRVDTAVDKFNKAYLLSNHQGNIIDLDPIFKSIKQNQCSLKEQYNAALVILIDELDLLSMELRTATIIATLSRVEASQAGEIYQESLNNVASNVESAALRIRTLIHESQKLVEGMNS